MTKQTLRTLRCYLAHKIETSHSDDIIYLEDTCKALDRFEFIMDLLERLMKDKEFLESSTAYLVEKLYSMLSYGDYKNEEQH